MTKNSLGFKPLHDRIVVETIEEDQKTAGGLYIPDTAKEKPLKGYVLATGRGLVLDNGEVQPLEVKEGDLVLFGKYAGTEIKLNDKTYLMMRESDVHGIIEK